MTYAKFSSAPIASKRTETKHIHSPIMLIGNVCQGFSLDTAKHRESFTCNQFFANASGAAVPSQR